MLQVTGATFKTQLFIFTKGEAIRTLHKQNPGMRKQRVSSGISIPLVPSERQYRSGFATISDTENRLLDSGATYKTLEWVAICTDMRHGRHGLSQFRRHIILRVAPVCWQWM